MRPSNISLLLFLSICLYSVAAVPDGLKHPEAYEKAMGDIVDAKQQYTKTIIKNAAEGDKSFQFILGKAYLQGKNMPVDMPEGRAWLKRAADNGHAEAKMMYALNMLDAGEYREAHEYLNQAASAFPGEANYHLGQLYFKGQGVASNRAKSVEFTRKAAEKGNADANFFMYKCLFYGVGVSKDTDKAMAYLNKAAEADHLEAIQHLVLHCLDEDSDKADKYLKKAEGLFDDKQNYEDWRKGILSQHALSAFKNNATIKDACRNDRVLTSLASLMSAYSVKNPSLSDCKKHIETCKNLERRDYPKSILFAIEGSRYLLSGDAEKLEKGLRKINGKWITRKEYTDLKSEAAVSAQLRAEEQEKARAEAAKNRPVYVMRDFPCKRCKGTGYTEGFDGKASGRRCLICKGKGKIPKKVLEGSAAPSSSYTQKTAKPKAPTFSKGNSRTKSTLGSSSMSTDGSL